VWLVTNSIDGWALTSTSSTLRVYNPSAASVTYEIELIGSP
jgi:hypothetical protein